MAGFGEADVAPSGCPSAVVDCDPDGSEFDCSGGASGGNANFGGAVLLAKGLFRAGAGGSGVVEPRVCGGASTVGGLGAKRLAPGCTLGTSAVFG